MLLEGGGGNPLVCDGGGIAAPDVSTIEALARLRLTAVRLGRQIRLRHTPGRLRDLIALTGLHDVLLLDAGSLVEVSGQAEEREEGLGVEEEGDPADPSP
jgi:anti-anti-sigma regulatory factor